MCGVAPGVTGASHGSERLGEYVREGRTAQHVLVRSAHSRCRTGSNSLPRAPPQFALQCQACLDSGVKAGPGEGQDEDDRDAGAARGVSFGRVKKSPRTSFQDSAWPRALRKNDVAIGELLRVYVHHNYAGQNAIDVRKTEELYMLSSDLPIAVFVFKCGICVQAICHTDHAH